ncbi:bifunctional phosphoribosylaminoimidazolecarboxamide formyltransferase/IMP cyclohydrolase [Enterococcus sp.]|uniref:bifunctional phosphoribosylaminoimidazolecarboxamide formyltransferase/IMP cyclohydrolase n=1 Tax=Enterococcus sp. TaxID=35783 RepID=UPI003C725BBC
MKKRALISVSDKTGILEFAKELLTTGFEIISTGGTKKALEEAGIATLGIEEVTGFPEMMDGRVKTLHPLIHGGLLGRRDLQTHLDAMTEHGITPIDVVVVNLYPFKETISKTDVTEADAIENIDIGGPSMLRSAAKNFAAVTVLVDPADYQQVATELKTEGETTLATRKALAAKVFRHTAAYDALIAGYLTELVDETQPEKLTLTYDLKQSLRYGENSHQQAAFYQDALPVTYSIAAAKQLHGKELSYNNIKDADAALRIAREFDEPAVVALKHMNPCGIGTAATIEEAYDFAYDADPVSIFGGILVANREIDLATAEKMHKLFLEIIIAPAFAPEAFEVLSAKKNLRLMTLDFSEKNQTTASEKVSVLGGLLVQDQDVIKETPQAWQVVTKRQPTAEELTALAFAWKAVKHVKSNAIVLANHHQTVGIGAGQMNRVGSVKIAIQQAEAADKMAGAVLASDAFFPMGDSVTYAAEHGIKAIIQPGGSIKDQQSIEAADEAGIAMVFTDVRHFRH